MLGPTSFLTKGKPGQGASGLGLGPTDTLTGGRKTAALAGDANEASSARGRKGAGEDGRRKAKKNPDQARRAATTTGSGLSKSAPLRGGGGGPSATATLGHSLAPGGKGTMADELDMSDLNSSIEIDAGHADRSLDASDSFELEELGRGSAAPASSSSKAASKTRAPALAATARAPPEKEELEYSMSFEADALPPTAPQEPTALFAVPLDCGTTARA